MTGPVVVCYGRRWTMALAAMVLGAAVGTPRGAPAAAREGAASGTAMVMVSVPAWPHVFVKQRRCFGPPKSLCAG